MGDSMDNWKNVVKTGVAGLLSGLFAFNVSKAQDLREVDVVVRDSYTLESLEGVVVNALQDNRIVGTGITNSAGTAYFEMASNAREGFVLSNAYPNPAKSNAKFELVIESSGSSKVELYNILGQRVFSQEEHLSKGSYTLDFQGLDGLANGAYFLVLSNEHNRSVERFIVSGRNNVYSGSPSLNTSFNPVPKGFEHDTYFVLSRPGYDRKETQARVDDRLSFLLDKQNEVFFESEDTLDVRVTGGAIDNYVVVPGKLVLPSGEYTLWYDGLSSRAEIKSDTTLHVGRNE